MSDTDFVNTAPGGATWSSSSGEDYKWNLDFWYFSYVFSDADNNGIKGIIYEDSPHLTLFMNGVAVEPGTFITLDQSSRISLQPDENFYGNTTFSFRYVDDGGTENGGSDTSNVMTWNFYFSSINDAPTAQDNRIAVDEDASHTLSTGDFGFADVDGDSLSAVIVEGLPQTGTLLLDGVAVTAGQSVSAADIAAGKLVWIPSEGSFGDALASLTFRVVDAGDVSLQYAYYSVQNTSVSSYTLTFDVSPMGNAPTAADGAIVIDRGGSHTFSIADFGFSDIDGDALLAVVVSRIDGAGRLVLNGVEVTQGQEVSAADIAAGRLVWMPADGNAAEGSFELDFRVTDDGRTGGRYTNIGAAEYTLRLDVNAAAVLSAADMSTREDKGVAIDVLAQASDADGDTLSLVSAEILSGGFGKVSIIDGKLFYDPTVAANQNLAAGETRTVTIRYTVSDGHGGDTTAEIVVTVAGIEGDVFRGTAGDDRLDGSLHGDVLYGYAGNDTYIVNNAGDRVVEKAGEGTDLVLASVSHTLANHVENLTLTGTGRINGTGNTLANVITGTGAANILDGGKGADTLKGGKGNDTYIVDNASDRVVEKAGEGTDLVKASVNYVLSSHAENLTLTGAGRITGTGNGLDNVITGNGANNILDGGKGADTLKGGAGRDTLIGGMGADKLHGGADADTFVFRSIKESTVATSGRDTITGFSQAEGDRINLRAIDANLKIGGDQAFKFIEDDAFHGKAGELRYQKKGGDTFVFGDVNGDGNADFSIRFSGKIDFDKGDFLL